jgi:hypothetical protein
MRISHVLLLSSARGLAFALALVAVPRGAAAQAAATMPPFVTSAPTGSPLGATTGPSAAASANPMESGFVSAPQTPNPFATPTPSPLLEAQTATPNSSGGSWGLLGLLGLLGLIGLRGSSRPT